MSIKEKAIEVLFDDDKNNTSRGPNILLPSNRWTRYHQLEHEYIDSTSIDSVFVNTIGLDLSKWISCVTDFGYGDISCKTGAKTYVKKLDSTFIKINGSRTTKHKTIEEKKKFFAIKKEDVYFCLARNKKEWEFGQKKYYLSIFKTLNHAKLEWKETFGKNGKSTGWSASSDEMKCKISKSMSDQLWTEVKEDYIDAEYPITIR
jgi:hypothetical protein